jgi:hypothetical protein
LLLLLVLAVSQFSSDTVSATTKKKHPVDGHWIGHIVGGDSKLELAIDMSRLVDGRWVCEVDVPDAGFDNVSFACTVFGPAITLRADGTELIGRLSEDHQSITGTLIQGDEKLEFVATRNGDAQMSKIDVGTIDDIEVAPANPHTATIDVVRKGPLVLLGVETLINGHGPYNLLLDTDNGYSEGTLLLNQDVVDRLSLPVSGEGEDKRATLGALRVAGFDVPSITANSLDMGEFFYGVDPPDGVLPISLLSGYTVIIDLPNHELTLDQTGLPSGREGVTATRTGEDGEPLVPARLGHRDIQAALNLSVRSYVNLPTAYLDSLTLLSEPQRIGYLNNSEGEFEILGARFEGTLAIGDNEIEVDNIRFSEIFKRPEVGYPALETFAITIDQGSGHALLVRSEPRIDIHTQAGAVANLADGKRPLKEAFNADPDNVRMILILSPT